MNHKMIARMLFDGAAHRDVSRFFFAYEKVVISCKTDDEKASQILCRLDGLAFDYYHESFSCDVFTTDESHKYLVVESKILCRFKYACKPKEEVHDAVMAWMDPSDIVGSLAKLNALYRQHCVNHCTSFGLLRKSVVDVLKMFEFVMYRALGDDEQLKKSTLDFGVWQKAFHSERAFVFSSLSEPRRLLARPDAPSDQAQQLESKVDQLSNQFSELSMLRKKNFEPSATQSWNENLTCSYCKEKGHGANR